MTLLPKLLPWMFALCVVPAGCSQLIDPNVPEPIRPMREPLLGREYLLYRPSSYDRGHSWPLIVVCHSSLFDSPNRQIRDWTQLAESHGFLVAVPRLTSTASRFSTTPGKQGPLQNRDEQHILALVRHIRAGHNISDDRVFLYGWSGGAYPALYTALRNPDMFRAAGLIQPRFEAEYLVDAENRTDAHQPILVHYNSGDALSGKDAQRCAQWLRSKGADVHEDPFGPARRSDTIRAVEFFERVIRNIPWIRIRVFPASSDNPLEMQFKLTCSHVPTRYLWEFGDGDVSDVAEPIHLYHKPGSYRITVTVDGPDGRAQRRAAQLTVPQALLQPIPITLPNN